MSEYDPVTCITAGELRDMGLAVPEHIPDVAWIRRSDIRYEVIKSSGAAERRELVVEMQATFLAPLQWIEVKGTITTEKRSGPVEGEGVPEPVSAIDASAPPNDGHKQTPTGIDDPNGERED